ETEGTHPRAITRGAWHRGHGRRERGAAAGRDGWAHERDAASHGFAARVERLRGDVHVHRVEAVVVEHRAIDPSLSGIASIRGVRDAEAVLCAGDGSEHQQRDTDTHTHNARPAHTCLSHANASWYRSSVKPRTSRSPSTRTGTRKKPSSWTRYLITSASLGAEIGRAHV